MCLIAKTASVIRLYVRPDSNGYHVKGDKFIVHPSRQTCFQPPEFKVYNVISFITSHPHLFRDYQDGMDPYRLVNLVCNRLLNNPIDRTTHPIIKSYPMMKDFNIKDYTLQNFQKYNFDNIKQFYPYFVNRGININTQKAFANHFMLATLHKENGTYFKNLSFPLRIPGKTSSQPNDLKDIVGFEERGRARLDGSSGYKGKARGSNSSEGLWIASPNNTELKAASKVFGLEVHTMQWLITNSIQKRQHAEQFRIPINRRKSYGDAISGCHQRSFQSYTSFMF